MITCPIEYCEYEDHRPAVIHDHIEYEINVRDEREHLRWWEENADADGFFTISDPEPKCDHCHNPVRPDSQAPHEWVHKGDSRYVCPGATRFNAVAHFAAVNGSTLVDS